MQDTPASEAQHSPSAAQFGLVFVSSILPALSLAPGASLVDVLAEGLPFGVGTLGP
jgi:hypothetical protein